MPAEVVTLRDRAMAAVQAWALEIEAMQAGAQKHLLDQVRELHLGAGGTGGRSGKLTARATATRRSARANPPRVPRGGELAEIMRAVQFLDEISGTRYYSTLSAWGLGASIQYQADVLEVSKPTVSRWFEGGLAIVMHCLASNQYR